MQNSSLKREREGFSLIEVMVATAILMVIVLMIGAVFRQASSAWDTGYARAEGGMIVRGAIGSIQRELAGAVDGRVFPDVWTSDSCIDVKSSELTFICYKEGKEKDSVIVREPHKITYKWTGSELKRTDVVLKATVSGWTTGGSTDTIVYSQSSSSATGKAPYDADFEFEAVDATHDPSGFRPHEDADFKNDVFWDVASVRINVELTRTGSFSGLEVRSYGRNGIADSDAETKDDDIIVK